MSLQVDYDHIAGAKEGFAAAGWGCEDEVAVEPDGEIPGGAGGIAEAMDPSSEAHELATEVHL